jgi:hypothetical protein
MFYFQRRPADFLSINKQVQLLKMLVDPDNIEANFRDYLNGFSEMFGILLKNLIWTVI